MAPCSFRKHQGVPAGGLALLVALVVLVGLSLPGGAAAQQQGQGGDKRVVIPFLGINACRRVTRVTSHLSCASGERDFEKCCRILESQAKSARDCGCDVLKAMEGSGIDVNKVCKTTGIAKPCEDKAEAARRAQQKKAEEERAAKEREDKLSTLDDPCERLLERLGAGETSRITPEDAKGCFQAMKTYACTASCPKQ